MTPAELADASFAAVMAKDREGWLGLFADDAIMQDPVGPSPYDPEGKGFRGKQELARLWDTVISQAAGMRFVVHERFVGGNESASRFTAHMTPGGGAPEMTFTGIAIHMQNSQGKLQHIKSYLTPAASRYTAKG